MTGIIQEEPYFYIFPQILSNAVRSEIKLQFHLTEEKLIEYKGYNSTIYSFSFHRSKLLMAWHHYSNDERSNVDNYLIFPVLSSRIFITRSSRLPKEVLIFSLNYTFNVAALESNKGSQLTGPEVGCSHNASNFC
jgi:hypothetical protein